MVIKRLLREKTFLRKLSVLLVFISLLLPASGLFAQIKNTSSHRHYFSQLLRHFSGTDSTNSINRKRVQKAAFIASYFKSLGFDMIGSQTFSSPMRLKKSSEITLLKSGLRFGIDTFLSNAISPDTTGTPGITGPLVYVGKGEMKDFNNKKIKDAIILMDMDSAGNWVNALSLGARAIIYVYKTPPDKFFFKDKIELSPVNFPKFIISEKKAEILFPGFRKQGILDNYPLVRLNSDVEWSDTDPENIYTMIPGNDENLNDQLIIVEGFYDTEGFIPGKSPGADQSCSIATLLDLARFLKDNPPKRSVLLAATAGHGNGLAGMRELIWAINIKSRLLKKIHLKYKNASSVYEENLEVLKEFKKHRKEDIKTLKQVQKNILDIVKTKVDTLSNKLMQLRLENYKNEALIKKIAGKRLALKRFENKTDLTNLSPAETTLLDSMVQPAIEKLEKDLENAQKNMADCDSAQKFKHLVQSKKIQMIISLHLSSHGNGIGAFNNGWLYDMKNTSNMFSPYVKLNDILLDSAKKTAGRLKTRNIFKDTLRPSLQRSWQSYFKDTPALGGEVSNLAGFLGLTLVTTNDARRFWGTPYDTFNKVNTINAAAQSLFISNLVKTIDSVPDLAPVRLPRNGFATLKGRANFLRHGAVFADAPAPGSVVFAFQGPGTFCAMVDPSGVFFIKGLATKKLTLHKAILAGYRFDKATGKTIWAVDKRKTTKARYRVKITKKQMETDLIMFKCSQGTILNLLEPRTFRYMTRLQLMDARMDATPLRYWYSRVDTRSSSICSIYLQPGTRLKLGLSDTLLARKIILSHAEKDYPDGNGYRIGSASVIAPTQYLAARDMWSLLNPRIKELEKKGINNQTIKTMQLRGNKALKKARTYLASMTYDKFFSASASALALAGRVYDNVQSIQRDVLYGVLFYITLFAPFAFCLERFLFSFVNIYKRIAGFLGIMIILIIIIYNVHPAFDLAYSPIVIILAFFITGLSAMVTWIIFHNFENEMKRLQRQGKRGNEGEISFLKAFSAAFFMGVNNLKRRRTRTVLTCTTLIVLTFTIMSFTSVKNIRQHSKIFYSKNASYQGLLMKQANWTSLPPRAFKIIANTMSQNMVAAPRVWLETKDRTQSTKIPIRSGDISFEARGLIGLSTMESKISGLSKRITNGRWFSKKDRYSIIIPERMAERLNLGDISLKPAYIRLWSIPFKVIATFSGKTFEKFRDLDGEPLPPAIFPNEILRKTTQAEMDAIESGEDVKSFQSLYKHIPFDQTAIIPWQTMIALGGHLKSIALKYKNAPSNSLSTFQIADRFGLWLFSGEKKGVFLYNASDSISYSGLPNVLIPVLISMFIVLNTMVGSVQERKKEIGIYTSIGMAPSHVSIIFIAEALAYAVLSVVLGYISAQVFVKVFAGTSLLNGITVNYSSLGGVFAMAMIMLVVLLSSIYPSRIAASIAIPDVNKSWGLAKAKGDTLNIALPFLVRTREVKSILGYLYNFFDAHQAVSHGIFSVGRLSLEQSTSKGDHCGPDAQINFTAWLAPFDLGIMQNVKFKMNPSPDFKDYMEIEMTITRKSGEDNTWWRINKRFVNLVRKQLLIWRSMDDTEKETYTSMGKYSASTPYSPILA